MKPGTFLMVTADSQVNLFPILLCHKAWILAHRFPFKTFIPVSTGILEQIAGENGSEAILAIRNLNMKTSAGAGDTLGRNPLVKKLSQAETPIYTSTPSTRRWPGILGTLKAILRNGGKNVGRGFLELHGLPLRIPIRHNTRRRFDRRASTAMTTRPLRKRNLCLAMPRQVPKARVLTNPRNLTARPRAKIRAYSILLFPKPALTEKFVATIVAADAGTGSFANTNTSIQTPSGRNKFVAIFYAVAASLEMPATSSMTHSIVRTQVKLKLQISRCPGKFARTTCLVVATVELRAFTFTTITRGAIDTSRMRLDVPW